MLLLLKSFRERLSNSKHTRNQQIYMYQKYMSRYGESCLTVVMDRYNASSSYSYSYSASCYRGDQNINNEGNVVSKYQNVSNHIHHQEQDETVFNNLLLNKKDPLYQIKQREALDSSLFDNKYKWSVRSLGLIVDENDEKKVEGVVKEEEPKLDHNEIKKLAEYVHLDLESSRLNQTNVVKDINNIMKCMSFLVSVPDKERTSGHNDNEEILGYTSVKETPQREDEVMEGFDTLSVLKNAKVTYNQYFVVPKTVK